MRLDNYYEAVDKVTKGLHEDINSQREQNETLKKELIDTQELTIAIKQNEDELERYEKGIKALKQNLNEKEEYLMMIRETAGNAIKGLENIKSEVNFLKKKEVYNYDTEEKLRKELVVIDINRNNLVSRINEATTVYERNIIKLNRDKENIILRNITRHNQLVSVTLFYTLRRSMFERIGFSLNRIKKAAFTTKAIDRALIRLAQLKQNQRNNIMSIRFNRWKNIAIDYIRELRINKGLVAALYFKRRAYSCFSKWRNEHYTKNKCIDDKLNAGKILSGQIIRIEQKRLRVSFNKWFKSTKTNSRRLLILKKYIVKKDFNMKRAVIHEILNKAKEDRLSDQFKALTDMTIETKLKRAIFFYLRESISMKEVKKILNAQEVFNTASHKKKKLFLAKALITPLLTKAKKEKNDVMKRAYNALKYNKLNERKNNTISILNQYITETAKFNEEIRNIKTAQKKTKQIKLIRIITFTFNKRIRYYLEKWYNSIIIQRVKANILRKNLLLLRKKRLIDAFNTWYNGMYKIKEEKTKETKELSARSIEQLLESNKSLDQHMKKHINVKRRLILKQLLKIINMINKKYLKRSINTWKLIVNHTLRYLRGIEILEHMLMKHTMKKGIRKYREVTRQITLECIRKHKENTIRNLVIRHVKIKSFYGLVIENYKCKYRKEIMRRTTLYLLHKMLSKYFSKWRTYEPNLVFHSLKTKNDLKAKEIKEYVTKVEQAKEQYSNLLEDLNRISKIQKKKTHLSIVKTLAVKEYVNMKRAINIWRNNTKAKRFIKLLIKQVQKSGNNKLRLTLYRWKSAVYSIKIGTIKDKLNKEKAEYNKTMKELIAKLKKINEDIKEAKHNTEEALKYCNIRCKQIKGVSVILRHLKNQCKKHSLRDSYFANWIKLHRRHKLLHYKIKSYMRQRVGKFIYRKLKMVYLIRNRRRIAMKCLDRLMNLYKKCNTTYFLKNWRRKAQVRTKERIHLMYEKCDKELIKHKEIYNKIKDCSNENYLNEILRRRKLKFLLQFKKQIEFQRVINRKTDELKTRLRELRVRRSFTRWKNNITTIITLITKNNKAIKYHYKNLQVRVLRKWRDQYHKNTSLAKVLQKLSNKQYLNIIGESLERMCEYAVNNKFREENYIIQGTNKIFNIMEKLHTRRLGEALKYIKTYLYNKVTNRRKLKSILIKCLKQKLRTAFDLWAKKVEEQILIKLVECKGKTAQQLLKTLCNHESLAKLIKDSKLEERTKGDTIDSDIKSKGIKKDLVKVKAKSLQMVLNEIHAKKKHDMVVKFIKKWLLSTKAEALKERFIGYWRNWLSKRRTIIKTSRFVLNRLKNTEKSWALHRLKNIKFIARKEASLILRDTLINKINIDSGVIETSKRECKEMDQLVEQYKNFTNKSKWIYNKGKTLAVSTLFKHLKTTLQHSFSKWKRATQKLIINDLKTVVGEKERRLKGLLEVNSVLKEKSKVLWGECGELRKSSMDGLEIAGIVQEIAREREQMSIDLANRSLTIKKLIEENISLQEQIDELQNKGKILFR